VQESLSQLTPWMAWAHAGYSVEEAGARGERFRDFFQNGTSFEFAVSSASGAYLGSCGLNHIDQENHRANLGYWVRTSAAGRGVATKGVELLSEWAFQNTDLMRLEILIAVGNTRSIRVAEKVGAVREGVLRKRLVLHGVAHDAVMFSLTR
jgi:ribosomal-protein-serine acetyltransferase